MLPLKEPNAPGRRGSLLHAALLFVALFAAYHANGTSLEEGDTVPSVGLSVALLGQGSLSFDPERFPEMFKWKSRPPFVVRDDFAIPGWSTDYDGRSAREWRDAGRLELNGPRYYLVESKLRHTFVSTFGPVPGLALFPFAAPFLAGHPGAHGSAAFRASVAKLGASAFVACAASLLYLVAARYVSRRRALFVALTYALATCAWAISSQTMWQQTVTQPFLVAGALFLVSSGERALFAALAGACIGIATACRPTGVFVLAFSFAHLLVARPRQAVMFLASAVPPLAAIGVYNAHYFGSPFVFAQELVGHGIALEKTGSPALWQTPLFTGALGLLASPSRGLLVLSPVLAPSLLGLARALRAPRWLEFRPLAAATVTTMLVQCKWFDWWGGHAYGYRPWLDVLPYLVLCLLPVLDEVLRTSPRRAAFGAAFAWSVAVQALGAWTYDRSWNARMLYVVKPPGEPAVSYFEERDAKSAAAVPGSEYVGAARCDIDRLHCRYRLWSLSDNLVGYQLTHLGKTRRHRLPLVYSPSVRVPGDERR